VLTATTWQSMRLAVGYVIDDLDITVFDADDLSTIAVSQGVLTAAPAPDALPQAGGEGIVWRLPAGVVLPSGGIRFELRGIAAQGLNAIGLGGAAAGATTTASVAARLRRSAR